MLYDAFRFEEQPTETQLTFSDKDKWIWLPDAVPVQRVLLAAQSIHLRGPWNSVAERRTTNVVYDTHAGVRRRTEQLKQSSSYAHKRHPTHFHLLQMGSSWHANTQTITHEHVWGGWTGLCF